jgi:hypothetical protein
MPPAVPYATTSQKQTRSTADSLLEICAELTIIPIAMIFSFPPGGGTEVNSGRHTKRSWNDLSFLERKI